MKATLNYILHPILYILPILAAVAFMTLLERKLLGYMQLRKGPNIVGPLGILQPIADGLKLLIKEPTKPTMASPTLFIYCPIMALTLALIMWAPLPMPLPLANMNLSLLFLVAASSMSTYAILWSGWSANSKYALIGGLRAVAQTVSYEVTLGLTILSLALFTGNYSMQAFMDAQESTWLILPTWPLAMVWYTSSLAETNRSPFDLTEGESELVSGFNVEYAAGPFALLFLAEYTNIIALNTISTILFLNPGTMDQSELFTLNLMLKCLILSTTFLWIRASYPRFRYDQLMHLVWKQFLPLTLALCLLHTSLVTSTNGIPPAY